MIASVFVLVSDGFRRQPGRQAGGGGMGGGGPAARRLVVERRQFERQRRRLQWRRRQFWRRRRIGELVAWASGASAGIFSNTAGGCGASFRRRCWRAIEQAIKAGEATHSGQVRFVVEGALDGAPLFRNQPARERALDIFSQLRIWDTAHNNGVLIYLLLADRDVEIVADRGIDARVGDAGWEKICQQMEADFRAGNFEGGVDQGNRGGVAANWRRIFRKPAAGRTNCRMRRW